MINISFKSKIYIAIARPKQGTILKLPDHGYKPAQKNAHHSGE